MMIWIRHWTCVDHQTTTPFSTYSSFLPVSRGLTDEEEKLHARLNITPKIKPTHNTQDETRDDLRPNQRNVTGDPLPSIPRRSRLSNRLCDVKERNAERQAPGDGGDVHVGLIGKIVDIGVGDEEASSCHLDVRPILKPNRIRKRKVIMQQLKEECGKRKQNVNRLLAWI